MAKPGKIMARVDASSGACAKLNCCTDSRTLHRHHRRHQAVWIGVWFSRRKGEEKFEEFKQRYYAFLPEDWTRLCENHHAEIHLVYDLVIRQDRKKIGRTLSRYSWTQAEKLMDRFEAVCVEWLKKDTPGVSSKRLEELRKRYYNRPPRSARSSLHYILND